MVNCLPYNFRISFCTHGSKLNCMTKILSFVEIIRLKVMFNTGRKYCVGCRVFPVVMSIIFFS